MLMQRVFHHMSMCEFSSVITTKKAPAILGPNGIFVLVPVLRIGRRANRAPPAYKRVKLNREIAKTSAFSGPTQRQAAAISLASPAPTAFRQ